MKFLDEFSVVINVVGDVYTVRYERGEYRGSIKYVKSPSTKYQRDIYIMTECDMGDIIEWRHKKKPFGSLDLGDVNMYIRDHSLKVIQNHFS